ncbi:protein inscuteable homolog [Xenopus tropicalis]|uniref:INSC, spindle orientation adaptor protein n=2 Tax=Xenopus tropicalis TaxID=8364 RepID=A0A803KCP5_XENTR|nr:protein inscuteable homolog [Xenopus tropicalis]
MAFQDGCQYSSLSVPFQRLRIIQVDSVRRWMDDLKLMTECECMCILQSKPIGKEEDAQSDLLLSSPGTAPSSLEILLKRAWIVSTELTKIVEKLMKSRWKRLHSMAIRVSCHVRSMLREYHSFNRPSTEEMHQFETLLMDKCSELTDVTERCALSEGDVTCPSLKLSINETLTSVGQYFSQLINLALTQEIKSLVAELNACDNIYSMEAAICSLYSLTQEGSRLCSLVAQEDAVVALFKICRQDCFRCLHSPALRTLASLCGVEEGLCQMEKVDGILCLTDMLTDETQPEATRAEVAAVIAQITSPHLQFTQHLSSFLENMEEIVTALLRLCKEASCGEVCLLASAALANVTFFDTLACEMLLQMGAMKILLNACADKQRIDTSFARDQIVTILANLSVLEQGAPEFVQENGVGTLMELLSEKSPSGRLSEISSCERVQQKAAVTLARLFRDPGVALSAIKLNCIPRLIKLCRSPDQRNNSDAVLVACLAALRRLATMYPEGLEDSDFKQLVKPRLVDSFLLCSNMEESFV